MDETKHLDRSSRQAQPATDKRVLVVYASKSGSTRGVAERVAASLREGGNQVDLRPVSQVDNVRTYDAVVFGSAIFNQRWMSDGEDFISGNLDALADRPVWLFSVGTFGDRKRIIGPLMKREPKGIRDFETAIGPRDYRVFAGVIDRHRWPFLSRLLYHALGGHLGDNRNWPDIEEWANGIARAVGEPTLSNRTQAA
jgi:menaquinone-dependent protoporphyrinogen oxidase